MPTAEPRRDGRDAGRHWEPEQTFQVANAMPRDGVTFFFFLRNGGLLLESSVCSTRGQEREDNERSQDKETGKMLERNLERI